ncbi:hypothetical protein Plec18167_002062 [Paecilomyces lecythidis]|uniref:Altered inheritance of mitochondria protein 9, mitochondrial n=1 Tax=Paecilomyces lecythidis TaxID=3004212 RepID=A0ABR3Y9K9_9EURO
MEHIELLNSGRGVLTKMIEDPRIKSTFAPILLHPDLHKRNIFVSEQDPTVVTAIIDWQSTSIDPAFYYADECPDFAIPSGDGTEEKVTIDDLCAQAFDACMKGLVPKLQAARSLDDDLLRLFRYCHRTWRDGAVAFRHELIELAKRWEDLGLLGSCPYSLPLPPVISAHERQLRKYEDAHKIKRTVVEFLETANDGWVPNETWKETQESHRLAFEHMKREVESAKDPEFTVEDLESLWPFDLPVPVRE